MLRDIPVTRHTLRLGRFSPIVFRYMHTTTRFSLLLSFALAFAFAGCRAEGPLGTAQVAVVFPNKAQFMSSLKSSLKTGSEVSALAAVNYNSLCFADNVKSPKISLTKNSCDVERGISMGSVPAGSEIVIADIPIGSDNTFEIYGLVKNNSSDTCPTINSTSWNHSLNRIYLIGKKSGVVLEKQDEEVTIVLTMPNQTAHIAYENSFPLSCTATGLAGTGTFVLGASVLTSASFKLNSRASFKEESIELTGTTMKIRNWKTGVSQ